MDEHAGSQISDYTPGPQAPVRLRKQRKPLRTLPVILASLALLGLGTVAGASAGYSNGYATASAEASARPVPTVTTTATVTKTETVTQAPYACSQAFQNADKIMGLAVDTINALSDTNKALLNQDTAGLTTTTAHLQSLNTQLGGLDQLRANYLVAKSQCH